MIVEDDDVVLLDDTWQPAGRMPKRAVHGQDTPLHLAFSCHLYNRHGDVLISRRALTKAAWPGVWSNAFCGHPRPGEALEDAVHRRAAFELGMTVTRLQLVLPRFHYRARDASGIVEHEVCPVFCAETRDLPRPNCDEVIDVQWVSPQALMQASRSMPGCFSPWMVSQIRQGALREFGCPPDVWASAS